MRSSAVIVLSQPFSRITPAAPRARGSAANACALPRNMLRGNWSSRITKARQFAGFSRQEFSSSRMARSYSGRKRVRISASKARFFSNQSLRSRWNQKVSTSVGFIVRIMPRMANRLANETSPYLQQHANNPVDWHPWGAAALDLAAREDKPILLSIGYSACHWCHVMAHESFENPEIAAVMNREYVNIKVGREERPDLDQIYQTAHQMLARGSGGWPLTMFLSPDGAAFAGGTYFPDTARHGLPGFMDLLLRITEIWRGKRAEIGEQNQQLRSALARTLPEGGAHRSELGDAPVRSLLQILRANFDARHGGFGRAPKFPHPTDLELCLRAGETEIALTTLRRMCEGGIYDQLGGGFCRYSVDQYWMIPHFEKML